METGWLCEPESAQFESWMSDAPWLKANQRHAHEYLLRHPGGILRAQTTMSAARPSNLFHQVFYGNSWQNPGEMMGFTSFYDTLDKNNVLNAVNVLDGDGGNDALTSIWVIGWGERTIFMVTPDGTPPHLNGEAGLVVTDWRYACRIANVDAEISGEYIEMLVDRALLRLPSITSPHDRVRTTIYMTEKHRQKFGREHHRKIFVRAVLLRQDERRVLREEKLAS